MSSGPTPHTRDERLALARRIAARLGELHGEALVAVGLYGSHARGDDGPFSDLDVLAVLRGGAAAKHLWSWRGLNAEVEIFARDRLLADAASVGQGWPLVHGNLTRVLPLHDPDRFFPELAARARAAPAAAFDAAMREVLVELSFAIAKLRNARARGKAIPGLGYFVNRHGTMLVGLGARHAYATSTTMLVEALRLPDLPDGYAELCGLCVAGTLDDEARVHAACEAFFAGAVAWAARRGIVVDELREIPF